MALNGSITITMTRQRYIDLLVSELKLDRLEAGGVDNWDWYGESLNPDDEPSFNDMEEEIITMVKAMD